MLADSIVSRKSIVLHNIITRNDVKDQWYTGTGYGSFGYYYSPVLARDHIYYMRCQWKYTTTNQNVTWVNMYFQGGGNGGPLQSSPVAGTEYTLSCIKDNVLMSSASYPINNANIYNANYSGVTAYARNMMVYDVTELYSYLKSLGLATSLSALKTWCDDHITYTTNKERLDLTSVIEDEVADKVAFYKGTAVATDFVDTDSMVGFMNNIIWVDAPTWRRNCYFDSGTNYLGIYNNTGNGNVAATVIDASTQNSPLYPEHKHILQVKTSGYATPLAGGILPCFQSAANMLQVQKLVAKIPSGYYLYTASNGIGSGSSIKIYPDNKGTGEWKEYTIVWKCGSSGSFSSAGHLYIGGTDNTNVTWYLAYCCMCNLTDNPDLQYWTAMPNKTVFKKGRVFAHSFDTQNLFPNGDGSDTSVTLPNGWSYDTEDAAGNAKASYSMAVGTSGWTYLTPMVDINPLCRYRISMWVKCKADMTNFLSAWVFYDADGNAFTHTNCVYKNGTATYLTQPVNAGDTTIKVNSTSNWTAGSLYGVGFRSSSNGWAMTSKNLNDGMIGNIGEITDSTTITLAKAYSGSTIPKGYSAVNSYAGGVYPYPIGKGNLPTDNTWKYIERYIGSEFIFDGSDAYDWNSYIPIGARKMRFLLAYYKNDGTVPIKFSDIRIEPVGKLTAGAERYEDKIAMKHYE